MKEKSLKEQNKPNLILFIAWNVIVLLVVLSSPIYLNDGEEIARKILSEDSLFMFFSPLLLIVLNGILSSRLKVFMVFWRWKNGLPGCRAFSRYIHSDPRINTDSLCNKHGELLSDPVKQNNLWYSFLDKHKENIIVKDSHKAYLLTRDMTAISSVFMLGIVVIILSGAEIQIKLLSSIYYVMQYLILMLVARNYGKRFTCNVLTIESQK